jgi:hypothetical protein
VRRDHVAFSHLLGCSHFIVRRDGFGLRIIGYEWTSLVAGNNLHRVVIYRDGANKVLQMEPMVMTPPLGSPDPRDLWRWMQAYETKTGGDVLAIPHNGNLSNGVMFPLEIQFNGTAIDQDYVEQRAKWEPNYEATQIKGDGEAHPFLSPDDEFADDETWDKGNLDLSQAKTSDMLAGEYAREVLKRGLTLEAKFGINPYQVGLQGATDSHTSLATAQEDNFFGKHSGTEPNPERMSHVVLAGAGDAYYGWEQVASGLTGVWATDNTREALFDAMERKEVYATTGSRMTVRFFGVWDFAAGDINSRHPAFVGYQEGVPWARTCRQSRRTHPRRRSWCTHCAVRSARTWTVSNSSRAGWTARAGPTKRSTTSCGPGTGKSERTASCRASAVPWMWRTQIGPTPSEPRNWGPSGWIPVSIPVRSRSTTPG